MADRRPIIAANWKMHKTHLEAIQAVQKLSYLLDKDDAERVEVVICPAFTALRSIQVLIQGDRLPYAPGRPERPTGRRRARSPARSPRPCSPRSKCGYVIVGHSERRQLFGETDETVKKKVRAVFAHGMVPILCVGETLEERDAGRTEEQVRRPGPARRSPALDAEQARDAGGRLRAHLGDRHRPQRRARPTPAR